MSLRVTVVETKKEWDAFYALPFDIYCGDPYWVPPLKPAFLERLNPKKNPFFRHALSIAFLAYRKGKPVGRIVGVIDDRHNEFHQEKAAFFGFFESFQDVNIANELIDAVSAWARSREMKLLRGPFHPSINDESGLLVEGFHDSPYVMMPYNPPYYQYLLQACGFLKVKDLIAYEGNDTVDFAPVLIAQAKKLQKRAHVKIRPIRMKYFEQELQSVLEVYNDAWEKNWGFVPMDETEIRYAAGQLKSILDPQLVLFAEVRGEIAGFALALPDIHQVFSRVIRKEGMSFFDWVRLFWHLKGPRVFRGMNRLRIVMLGIKRKYQELGIGPLFYLHYLKVGRKLGYHRGEASWILEDNHSMNRALARMHFKKSKVYRLFEKPIALGF